MIFMKRNRAMIVRVTLAASVLLACNDLGSQQATSNESDFHGEVDRLIRMTGYEDLFPQIIAQIIGPLRSLNPSVPDELWDELISEFDADEMIELTIPIYEKHFSQHEIQELLAFYSTPLGRKLIATLPAVTQESIAVGQQYGLKAAQRVIERLLEEGYDVRKGSA